MDTWRIGDTALHRMGGEDETLASSRLFVAPESGKQCFVVGHLSR